MHQPYPAIAVRRSTPFYRPDRQPTRAGGNPRPGKCVAEHARKVDKAPSSAIPPCSGEGLPPPSRNGDVRQPSGKEFEAPRGETRRTLPATLRLLVPRGRPGGISPVAHAGPGARLGGGGRADPAGGAGGVGLRQAERSPTPSGRDGDSPIKLFQGQPLRALQIHKVGPQGSKRRLQGRSAARPGEAAPPMGQPTRC